MLKAANFIEAIQNTQGSYVSSIEEIAFRRGFIDAKKLIKLGEQLKNTDYGNYLVSIANGDMEGKK